MNRLYAIVLIFVAAVAGYSQSTVLTGGNNFSVGLCGNGAVYAWGSNESGQIGQGSATAGSLSIPTKVVFTGLAANRTFLQVNAGSGAHALALDCSGHVWVWGENICGQVGNTGSTGVPNIAQCTTGTGSAASAVPLEVLRGSQAAAGTGENSTYLHSIKVIGGGNNFSMAVDSSGNVWSWGENEFGELGNGGAVGNIQPTPVQVVKCAGVGNLTNIVYVQGGDQTAYALDATGAVWAWGKNDNKNLGNGTTGNTAGAGSSNCAVQVYKSTATTVDTSFTATITTTVALGIVPLTGIKQIAAGDTHGMALDSSGQVWTWGGDWAPGQLGQGNNYVTNHFASKVVAPLAYTENTNSYNFTAPIASCSTGTTPGCNYITNAVFIAGGQASSAVVLATGEVVTFGGQGLYPGSACGSGNLLFSGTLGNGLPSTGAQCQSNATRCQTYTAAGPTTTPAQANPTTTAPVGCAGFGVPTYVETAAGVPLKNIVSVARADAWYFATSITGQVYAWGFNGAGGVTSLTNIGNWGGELGNGTTTDAPYAITVTLPGGCNIATPCPTKPSLGSAFSLCSGTYDSLTAGESQVGYTYTWYSSPTGAAGSWTTLTQNSGLDSSTLKFTMGASAVYYKVAVNFTVACGPCSPQTDSILISPIVPTWTAKGNYCTGNPNVQFIANDPAGKAQFEWFTYATGGTAIPGATGTENDTITLPQTSAFLNTSFASGATCDFALFVQDTATYTNALHSALPCIPNTPVTSNSTGINGALTLIYISQSVTINSVELVINGAGTATYSFSIYNNVASTGGTNTLFNCNSTCSGGPYSGVVNTPIYTSTPVSHNNSGGGNVPYTLTGSYALSPGYYWIGINMTVTSGNPNYVLFSGGTPCSSPSYTTGTNQWTSAWQDGSGYNIMKGLSAVSQQTIQDYGALYNIKFSYHSPYNCSRLLACATSGICPTPVRFLAFTAVLQNPTTVDLAWSTVSEQNSSYFDIQRSTDGVSFTSIGKVTAAGNSSAIINYTYADNSISELNGTIYYRIVEYDINGKTTPSAIASVNTGKGQDVRIIPNPSNGNFEVVIEGESESITLTLYNSFGQVVYMSSEKAEGSSTFSKYINIQNLAAGVYYLNINSPSNSWIRKIVKE